jgi:hypothetical protein
MYRSKKIDDSGQGKRMTTDDFSPLLIVLACLFCLWYGIFELCSHRQCPLASCLPSSPDWCRHLIVKVVGSLIRSALSICCLASKSFKYSVLASLIWLIPLIIMNQVRHYCMASMEQLSWSTLGPWSPLSWIKTLQLISSSSRGSFPPDPSSACS